MGYLKIEDMPGVRQIIVTAEKDIEAITGSKVFITIDAFEIKATTKDLLKRIVCDHFEYAWVDIIGKKRSRKVSDAMHAFMYIATQGIGCTFVETARYCSKDHSTVVCAVKKIKGYYKVNDNLCNDIEIIKEILKNKINEKI